MGISSTWEIRKQSKEIPQDMHDGGEVGEGVVLLQDQLPQDLLEPEVGPTDATNKEEQPEAHTKDHSDKPSKTISEDDKKTEIPTESDLINQIQKKTQKL